jgi:hypothetical protein
VRSAARDGNLAWVRWSTTADGAPLEVLQWGNAGSSLTFAVNGMSVEQADATAGEIVAALGR